MASMGPWWKLKQSQRGLKPCWENVHSPAGGMRRWMGRQSTSRSLSERRRAVRGRWTWRRRTAPLALADRPGADGRGPRRPPSKVTKEVFDEETREFQSVIILKLGAAESGAKAEADSEDAAAALRHPAGPLHRPRPRADRPPAGRLARAQQRHAVRTAAPPRPGREAGGVRHRPAARRPEARHPRGPRPRRCRCTS